MTLRHFLKHTAAGRMVLIPYRFVAIALPGWVAQFFQMLRWALVSKEHYNHTYHLTPLNRDYLASTVAVVTGLPCETADGFVRELESDDRLGSVLRSRALNGPDRHNSDAEPRYGRRLAWYALVRATRPRVVLETGVDRGLGTAVLAAALVRNAEEGFPGVVYATDNNPQCGSLLTPPYSDYVRILLGDSVASIKEFREPVDIFLHDSDHRPAYEWEEFLAVEPRLHADSIVLSDNSRYSPMLRQFAQRVGKQFLYFQDQPKNHWWPGDGLGIAFGAPCAQRFQHQARPEAGTEAARRTSP